MTISTRAYHQDVRNAKTKVYDFMEEIRYGEEDFKFLQLQFSAIRMQACWMSKSPRQALPLKRHQRWGPGHYRQCSRS